MSRPSVCLVPASWVRFRLLSGHRRAATPVSEPVQWNAASGVSFSAWSPHRWWPTAFCHRPAPKKRPYTNVAIACGTIAVRCASTGRQSSEPSAVRCLPYRLEPATCLERCLECRRASFRWPFTTSVRSRHRTCRMHDFWVLRWKGNANDYCRTMRMGHCWVQQATWWLYCYLLCY